MVNRVSAAFGVFSAEPFHKLRAFLRLLVRTERRPFAYHGFAYAFCPGMLNVTRDSRGKATTTWVTLLAYVVGTGIVGVGGVLCEGPDGHQAIETPHQVCSTSGEKVSPAGNPWTVVVTHERSCDDTPIALDSVSAARRSSDAELKFGSSVASVGAVMPPSWVSAECTAHPQGALARGDSSALRILRSVVLLI